MPSPIPKTALGRADFRAKAGTDWVPLDEYIGIMGCSERTVRKRGDIPTKKIDGHVFVARSALSATFRGRRAR